MRPSDTAACSQNGKKRRSAPGEQAMQINAESKAPDDSYRVQDYVLPSDKTGHHNASELACFPAYLIAHRQFSGQVKD
jgi:hypothetical protein